MASKTKKAKGSTATVAEVASQHITETAPAPTPATSEETASPLVSDEAALELLKVTREEMSKSEDSLNEFYAELDTSVRGKIRTETQAFLADLKEAAGKVAGAMSHLYIIHTTLNNEEMFTKFSRALVREGHITAGTLYTLTEKIKVFETLQVKDDKGNVKALPDVCRSSIMAISNGDSVIVRRPLTRVEVEAFKKAHPGTKVPKGVYEASKYFTRACEVVALPPKLTPDASDTYAGQVIRLAAKLRGKDRSGKAAGGDESKVVRFGEALDKLEKLIIGESIDGKVTGMLVLADADKQNELFVDAAETIIQAVCQRLPLKSLDELYTSVDTIFTAAKDKANRKATRASSAA